MNPVQEVTSNSWDLHATVPGHYKYLHNDDLRVPEVIESQNVFLLRQRLFLSVPDSFVQLNQIAHLFLIATSAIYGASGTKIPNGKFLILL